jgi:uncharacterized protein
MADNSDILIKLKALPASHHLAFAASCCERMVPNYHAFSTVNSWGEPVVLDDALHQVWKDLTSQEKPLETIRHLQEQLDSMAPDDDDFGTIYTHLAIHAGGALWCLLDYQIGGDFARILAVSQTALQSIEYYVMAVNWPTTILVSMDQGKALNEWIKGAPLVHAEIEKQARDVALLSTQDKLAQNFIETFRRQSTETGIYPAIRGLVVDSKKK